MSIDRVQARQLATTTKTHPMWGAITPRWLLRLMPWVHVEAGTYRVNEVVSSSAVISEHELGEELPLTFAGYETEPREFQLYSVQSILKIHTTIQEIYNSVHNQFEEQLRLTIEAIREEQELKVIQSETFGLLNVVDPSMRIQPRLGPPIPDDFDELLVKIWKKPALFLAHPRAIAAFGREVTKRGVCIGSVEMFGSPFGTWRGVPIIPCDKLPVTDEGKTNILLMRLGEEEQGVVGLYQEGILYEREPSLSVRSNGVDRQGFENWQVTLYFSVAVLTPDALGVLENADVTQYGDPRFEHLEGA